MRPGEVAGLVAVVTGASSGIGRRIAHDLGRLGASVTGLARTEDKLAELAASVPTVGYRVCDVSEVDAYAQLLNDLEREHGRIDLLVNCAGVEERRSALESDLRFYRWIFETNLFAAVAGTLAVLPGMAERGRGFVLNVSSDHGRAPGPDTAAYCASKGALSAFTEAVAHEMRPRGVHVHVLYPGWAPTGLGQGAVEQGMPMPPKAVRRSVEEVSRAAIDGLGGRSIDINAAPLGALAPVARALVPGIYRRGIERANVR